MVELAYVAQSLGFRLGLTDPTVEVDYELKYYAFERFVLTYAGCMV